MLDYASVMLIYGYVKDRCICSCVYADAQIKFLPLWISSSPKGLHEALEFQFKQLIKGN